MPHHRRQTRLRLGHGENAGVNRHLSARQRKGVGCLIILDHRDLPLKLLSHLSILRPFRGFDDSSGNPFHGFDFSRVL